MVVELTSYIDEIDGEIVLEGSSDKEDGKHVSLEDDSGTRIALYTLLKSGEYELNNVVMYSARVDIASNLSLLRDAHGLISTDSIKIQVRGSSSDIWYETYGRSDFDSDSVEMLEDVVSDSDDVWLQFVVSTDTDKMSPSEVDDTRQKVGQLCEDLLEKPQAELYNVNIK